MYGTTDGWTARKPEGEWICGWMEVRRKAGYMEGSWTHSWKCDRGRQEDCWRTAGGRLETEHTYVELLTHVTYCIAYRWENNRIQ